jgi:hypothetical protein
MCLFALRQNAALILKGKCVCLYKFYDLSYDLRLVCLTMDC